MTTKIVNGNRVEMSAKEMADIEDERNNRPLDIPSSVTRVQFLRALARSGAVGTIKSSFPGNNPNDEDRIMWEECACFIRGSETVALIQTILAYTEQQIDDLFILAGSI